MIAQRHRFHGRNSLKPLFAKGGAVRADHFTLRHMANSRRSGYRLAVVVSKKVEKRAVVRNRIRRRLYELFRRRFGPADLKADLAVIVLKKELAEVEHDRLQALFQPVFARLEARYGRDG
ncbi:ribonuclease P protein component [Candidatus Saccharibacteria bacterium]|nr:ribonuclease P protein component [Candidatus Saccharibacteria bacterium]